MKPRRTTREQLKNIVFELVLIRRHGWGSKRYAKRMSKRTLENTTIEVFDSRPPQISPVITRVGGQANFDYIHQRIQTVAKALDKL